MTDLPLAHIAGIPIEETVASFGPALLVALAATWTKLRAHLHRPRADRAPYCSDDVLPRTEVPPT